VEQAPAGVRQRVEARRQGALLEMLENRRHPLQQRRRTPDVPGQPIDWEDEKRRFVRGDGNFWR
jgi:hypothetical protein